MNAPDKRFILRDFTPAYLDAAVRASLEQRAVAARAMLRDCRACPRECGVDRVAGQRGACGVGRAARVASAFPHHGEEACLRGDRGSGTIFFSGCNLRCAFCQNADISQDPSSGRPLDAAALAGLMLDLQEQGCHNINLVTPEHVGPQVVEALALAIRGGLSLPIVYNTSGYDGPATLALLDGLVDVYMPDFKFFDSEVAERLCGVPDYSMRARAALREMHRQVDVLRCTPDGLACRGVLVRHLVMPGLLSDSEEIFKWLAEALSCDTYINIMGQYHPPRTNADGWMGVVGMALGRVISGAELAAAFRLARAAGLWRIDAPERCG